MYDELDHAALAACLQRLTREESLLVFLSLKDNDAPELMNRTVCVCQFGVWVSCVCTVCGGGSWSGACTEL